MDPYSIDIDTFMFDILESVCSNRPVRSSAASDERAGTKLSTIREPNKGQRDYQQHGAAA